MRSDIVLGNQIKKEKARSIDIELEEGNTCAPDERCIGKEKCGFYRTVNGRCLYKNRKGCCEYFIEIKNDTLSPAGGIL